MREKKEIGFRINLAKMRLKLLRPKWVRLKFKQANLIGLNLDIEISPKINILTLVMPCGSFEMRCK